MKVLVVEDEKKLADAIKRGLSAKGHTCDLIAGGAEALERIVLHHEDYDIVILDLMLPDMDGHTICQTVRDRNVHIPILILTAQAETSSKVELLRSGADDYVVKPFSFDELTERLNALLRRPEEFVPTVLRVGEIELDASQRTVKKAGQPVKLTLKEFSLLEYFMRNPNRVINREELLNHLWDFNYTSFFSNSLDVHVKNLRKKLDHDRAESILETVRGIGYRLHSGGES